MKFRRFLLPVLLPVFLAASLPAAETPIDLGDGDRVLVLSAHPGDEILSCAGLLQEANDLDLPVQVACLTGGEPDEFFSYFVPGHKPRNEPLSRRLRQSSERRNCVLDAAAALGLPEEAYVFFGYPSGGLATLWREVWREAPGWVSPRQRAQTPAYDVRTPSAPFTALSVLADVEGAIRDFAPTHLFVPSPLEASEDHRAAYAFARAALLDLAQEGFRPRVYTFFTHAADWPAARAEADGPLDPPEGEADRLAEATGTEIATLRLAPFQRERAEKARGELALPPGALAGLFAASDERFPAAPEAAALPAFESAYGETRYGADGAFLALAGATQDDLDARDEARALAEKTGNAFVGLEAEDEGDATRVTLLLARPKAAGVEVRLCAYAACEGTPFAACVRDVRRTYDADRPDDARTFTFRLEKQPGETARIITAELVGAHGLPLDDLPPVLLRTGGIPAENGRKTALDVQNPPETSDIPAPADDLGTVLAENGPQTADAALPPPEPAPEPPQKAPKTSKKASNPAKPASTSPADRPMAW
jgi:LmbE family N-acetylglucosaminyl deacetylase